MSIDSFKGTFLSNFWECRVEFGGRVFGNAEAAYQSAKCSERAVEFQGLTAKQAKARGKRVPARPDWDTVRVDVMREVLRAKFSNPELRAMLVATAPEELVEGNRWGDRFWGRCKREGQNMLGRLLMELRDEHLKTGTSE